MQDIVRRYESAVGPHGDLTWCYDAVCEIKQLRALAEMLAACLQGAQEEFVRVPYGASHEDVAYIQEWRKLSREALDEWEKNRV